MHHDFRVLCMGWFSKISPISHLNLEGDTKRKNLRETNYLVAAIVNIHYWLNLFLEIYQGKVTFEGIARQQVGVLFSCLQ